MKIFESSYSLLSMLSAGVASQSVQVASSLSSAPVIDLGYVKYAGYRNTTIGIDYYRGIPYASVNHRSHRLNCLIYFPGNLQLDSSAGKSLVLSSSRTTSPVKPLTLHSQRHGAGRATRHHLHSIVLQTSRLGIRHNRNQRTV